MTAGSRSKVLSELGEFAILERVIFPAARRWAADGGLGDDCGFVELGSALVAVSADVGPRPLVQQLPGFETDFEAAGWHAVVTTASDLATAAAKPWFLVDTIDAPADLPLEHLEAFVEGYFRACSTLGFRTAGGDLRQGPALAARVFGAGVVEHGRRIGRTGVVPGDHLVLLGDAGAFIAAFLLAERAGASQLDPEALERLRFPRPRGREMQVLAAHGVVSAASDSSDGVLGAIANIAARSSCGFELMLEDVLLSTMVKNEAHLRGCDPWNLFFFWGDWSVVAVVPERQLPAFESVAARDGVRWLPLGRAVKGRPRIDGVVRGARKSIRPLRNENFVARSFNAGVRTHVDEMLLSPLFSERTTEET